MTFTLAERQDLAAIEAIYAEARAYMKETGNADQWGTRYPETALILADIAENALYTVRIDGEIAAVFYFRIGSDDTYREIDGAWQNETPYAVIHRVAVSDSFRGCGVARAIFDFCYACFPNLKIDTHENNLPMQRTLERNGFRRCGTVYTESGDARIAYQRCK